MDELPLKDIHLPDAIGFWPPAPGWWWLTALLPLLTWLLVHFYRRLRRRSAVKVARSLLSDLRLDKSRDPKQTLAELSALLRRVAISRASRAEVASLRGEAWLAYLDHSLPDAPFSQGSGRCLADGHYRQTQPSAAELDALFELCERWLKQQGKRP